MTEQGQRLGDLIDDYCPRCRLLLNHAIASFVGESVAKVICQTCFTEHPFRHGEGATRKNPNARATLIEQVLARAAPSAPASAVLVQKNQKKKTATPARYISRHKTKPPHSR
jgi:hypothetical protein